MLLLNGTATSSVCSAVAMAGDDSTAINKSTIDEKNFLISSANIIYKSFKKKRDRHNQQYCTGNLPQRLLRKMPTQ
jgi:hypothetical protein